MSRMWLGVLGVMLAVAGTAPAQVFRELDVRLDVGAGRAVDSRGVWLDEHDLWLYLDDGSLLRLTLVRDFQAYGVSTNAELRLGIRASRTNASYLALSAAGDWNVAGDWGSTNPTNGLLSVRLYTNTEEMAAALAAAEDGRLTGWAELQMQDPPGTGPFATLAQWPIGLVHDVVRDPDAPPTPLPDPYVTAAGVSNIVETMVGEGVGGGDITAVVAGPGLSGGATSGAATVTVSGVTSGMLADGAALAEILDDDGPGSGLDADTVDGAEAAALEESAEIDADIAAHAGDAEAHQDRVTLAGEDYLSIAGQEITAGPIETNHLSAAAYAALVGGGTNLGWVTMTALSSDPADRGNGTGDIWMSDGTGSGDDGDVLVRARNSSGDSTVLELLDHDGTAGGLVMKDGGDTIHVEAGSINFTGNATVTSNDANQVTVDVGAGGGGGSIVVDLGDDASNESTNLAKIVTSGDTYGAVSEAGDVLTIDLAQKWPLAHRVAGLNGASGVGTLTGSGTLQFPAGLSLLMWDGVFLAAGVGSFDHGVTIGDAVTATGEGAPIKWRVYHDVGSPGAERAVYLWPYIQDVGEPVRFFVATNSAFSTGHPRLLTTADEGSGNGVDADTVDGVHAAALEESAEIDADIAAHAGDADAHHEPVALGGALDYLTIDGSQQITRGPIDLATDTTGSLPGDEVAFADPDSNFAVSHVQGALAELDDVNGSGPNAADAKVDWSQLGNVPAGFADGTDDGGGGSIVLDLGDNGSNESTAIAEIAVTGDTYGVVSEPSADKVLFDMTKKWPTANAVTTINGATAGTTSGTWLHTGAANVLGAMGFFGGATVSGADLVIGKSTGTWSRALSLLHEAADDPGGEAYYLRLRAYRPTGTGPSRIYVSTNATLSLSSPYLLTSEDDGGAFATNGVDGVEYTGGNVDIAAGDLNVSGSGHFTASLGIGTNAPTTGLNLYAAATNDEIAVRFTTEEGEVFAVDGDGDLRARGSIFAGNAGDVLVGSGRTIGSTGNMHLGSGGSESAPTWRWDIILGTTLRPSVDNATDLGQSSNRVKDGYFAGVVEMSALETVERSTDPGTPAEGRGYIWQSNGTGSGDDGDIMVKITAGGVTKTVTLVDFSSL